MKSNIQSEKDNLKSKISNRPILRVLMVEETEDDALLEILALKKGGYSPVYDRVETAEAFVKALHEQKWDVILCDYRLPHFNAVQAISLYKEAVIDIPFIIVSGAIGEEMAVECMRMGAHDYVMKGNMSRLVPAMEREIAEAASRAERRRAEVALKESEMRYKLIFENMSSCVATYEVIDDGADFIIRDFNRSAEQAEQIDRKDILGKSIFEVFPGVRDMGLWKVLQRVWRTGQPEHFPAVYYKDARTEGWRDNYVYKLPTGEVVALYNDITERKKAEIRIFESEEKYRMLVENSSEAIFIAQDAKLKFINRAVVKLFGASYEVAVSTPFTEFIHPEDRELVLKSHLRRLRGEAVPSVYAFRVVAREGTIRWVEIHSTIIPWRGKPATLNFLTDITDRRQAEDALRASEERFKSIVSTNRDWIWAIDSEGRHTYSNPAIENILGYHPDEIARLGPSRQLIHEEDIPIMDELMARSNEQRRGWSNIVLRWKHRDGTYRYLESNAVPILDSMGTVKGFQGSDHDITNRKQAEEKLKKSEEKYRSILENIAEGYYEVDLAGNFTFVNDSMCRSYGYLKEELLGLNYKCYFDKSNVEKMFRIFNEIYKTEKPSKEYSYELIRKDGVKRYIEASASLIKDSSGKPAGFKGIVRDVTEHRKMEEAIHQSEERYRTIIEQMEDGYFETDLAGNYTFANDAECRNLGYSREEIIGMNNRQYVDKEKAKDLYQAFKKIYETGIPIKAYDLEVIKKDGTKAYNEISAALIRDAQGKPIGFRGISRDVTERKKTEHALEVRMKQLTDLADRKAVGTNSLPKRPRKKKN